MSVSKTFMVLFVLLLIAHFSVAQSCECIDPSNCNPCQGSLNSLTLSYNGSLDTYDTYKVRDAAGELISPRFITSDLQISSRVFGQAFEGNFIVISFGKSFTFTKEVIILTSCNEIKLGKEYNGLLTVLSGISEDGPICCAPEDTDQVPPEILNCPANVELIISTGCDIPYSWTEPDAIDDCGFAAFKEKPTAPAGRFPVGETLIRYVAVDGSGNESVCEFTISVRDETAPVFSSCPVDSTVYTSSSCEATYSWSPPTATDNCTAAPTITSSNSPGDIFPLGTTVVEYTATDESGNASVCSFNVTVMDDTDPVFTFCPENLSVAASENCATSVNWQSPTATDNCSSNLQITQSHNSGDSFPVGTTIVTYTATDDYGNLASCTFEVAVIDESSPVFSSCPADITVSANDNCEAVVNWEEPAVTDNCTGSPELVFSHQNGGTFPIGSTTVTYTATDEAGNFSSCSFNVIVEDDASPVFSNCPANVSVSVNDDCEQIVSWEDPGVMDNCSDEIQITQSHQSGTVFSPGITVVTYTASDQFGNEAICSFQVNVADNSAPVFSACPENIVMTADASCQAKADWTAPVSTDNCNIKSLESNFKPGDSFQVGVTEVIYTATDDSGNESICRFTVTVNNLNEAEVSNCPSDITLKVFEADDDRAYWDEPIVEWKCENIRLESTHSPGEVFPEGRTEVIYTYIKGGESFIACSFFVEVSYGEIEFEIPKVLTPNNDSFNDQWTLEGIEEYKENTVLIVDRWGNEVYRATGYNNESIVWEGTNRSGDLVPTGTYFYFIKVNAGNSAFEKNGFIELIR